MPTTHIKAFVLQRGLQSSIKEGNSVHAVVLI